MAVKIHVGCGDRRLPGWVHVDARDLPGVVVGRAQDLDRLFPWNCADQIYHCAVLEHVPRNAVVPTLTAFRRVLRPGGQLFSSVPNFAAVVQAYACGYRLDELFGVLYGRHDHPDNVHYGTFDQDHFYEQLADAGFLELREYDWRSFLPPGYDDFSRAYLPHMDESGLLMMLNVVARKGTSL